MNTKDQAIAPHAAVPSVATHVITRSVGYMSKPQPAPDCRTCEYGSRGDGIWKCDKCVLGDMYKERTKVVLWRTEP